MYARVRVFVCVCVCNVDKCKCQRTLLSEDRKPFGSWIWQGESISSFSIPRGCIICLSSQQSVGSLVNRRLLFSLSSGRSHMQKLIPAPRECSFDRKELIFYKYIFIHNNFNYAIYKSKAEQRSS